MVDTRLAQDQNPEVSSNAGRSNEINQDPPPPPPQGQIPAGIPTMDPAQQQCLMTMKAMFDHMIAATNRVQPAHVPAVATCAPIDKLAMHRAYTFTGEGDDVLEVAENWLEKTTKVVTKQLSCSDEHKLDCVVALLAGDALSWWETTSVTANEEDVTWDFFVEEF